MSEQQIPAEPPITFQELAYVAQHQINYLNDIGAIGPQYAAFLQSLNYNETQDEERSHFDSIADDLYKKIVKQGYVDRPSRVAKKAKKGDAEVNFYNINDSFIDDEDCCVEKKDKIACFEDFNSVQVSSIQELYASPHYKKLREELIVEEGKRKAELFTLNEAEDKERFDQMRKNIKNIILGRHPKFTTDNKDNPGQPNLDKTLETLQEPIQKQSEEPSDL